MSDGLLFEGRRLSLSRSGAVAVARLFNPPHGCMDAQTETELATVLDRIDATPEIRALIFTGRDAGLFIRHYDVAVLEQRGREMTARGLRFSLDRSVPESPYHKLLARIEASGCIFIAAINGACMGGGYELALACDLRYAQRGDFRIGLPEINIGLLPGAGGTQKLPRVMGATRALEALLLGRTFAPDEAHVQGLVHGVTDDALAHARRVADAIVAKPAAAVRHIKYLVRRSAANDLAAERTLFCDLMVNAESQQRMADMNAGRRDITDP